MVAQPNNPLHGVKLKTIVEALVQQVGWAQLARRLPIPAFVNEPTLTSSLKFLRRHPEARAAVEQLYLDELAAEAELATARKPASTD